MFFSVRTDFSWARAKDHGLCTSDKCPRLLEMIGSTEVYSSIPLSSLFAQNLLPNSIYLHKTSYQTPFIFTKPPTKLHLFVQNLLPNSTFQKCRFANLCETRPWMFSFNASPVSFVLLVIPQVKSRIVSFLSLNWYILTHTHLSPPKTLADLRGLEQNQCQHKYILTYRKLNELAYHRQQQQ